MTSTNSMTYSENTLYNRFCCLVLFVFVLFIGLLLLGYDINNFLIYRKYVNFLPKDIGNDGFSL